MDAIIVVDMEVGLLSGAPKLAKAGVGQLSPSLQGVRYGKRNTITGRWSRAVSNGERACAAINRPGGSKTDDVRARPLYLRVFRVDRSRTAIRRHCCCHGHAPDDSALTCNQASDWRRRCATRC